LICGCKGKHIFLTNKIFRGFLHSFFVGGGGKDVFSKRFSQNTGELTTKSKIAHGESRVGLPRNANQPIVAIKRVYSESRVDLHRNTRTLAAAMTRACCRSLNVLSRNTGEFISESKRAYFAFRLSLFWNAKEPIWESV